VNAPRITTMFVPQSSKLFHVEHCGLLLGTRQRRFALAYRFQLLDIAKTNHQRYRPEDPEAAIDHPPVKRDPPYRPRNQSQQKYTRAGDQPKLDHPFVAKRINPHPHKQDGEDQVSEGQPVSPVRKKGIRPVRRASASCTRSSHATSPGSGTHPRCRTIHANSVSNGNAVTPLMNNAVITMLSRTRILRIFMREPARDAFSRPGQRRCWIPCALKASV